MVFKVLEVFGMVLVEVMVVGVFFFCYDYMGILDVIGVVKEVDFELGDLMCLEVCLGGVYGVVDGVFLVEQLLNKVEKVFKFMYFNGFCDNSK